VGYDLTQAGDITDPAELKLGACCKITKLRREMPVNLCVFRLKM